MRDIIYNGVGVETDQKGQLRVFIFMTILSKPVQTNFKAKAMDIIIVMEKATQKCLYMKNDDKLKTLIIYQLLEHLKKINNI
jgi:hypothetical protein